MSNLHDYTNENSRLQKWIKINRLILSKNLIQYTRQKWDGATLKNIHCKKLLKSAY